MTRLRDKLLLLEIMASLFLILSFPGRVAALQTHSLSGQHGGYWLAVSVWGWPWQPGEQLSYLVMQRVTCYVGIHRQVVLLPWPLAWGRCARCRWHHLGKFSPSRASERAQCDLALLGRFNLVLTELLPFAWCLHVKLLICYSFCCSLMAPSHPGPPSPTDPVARVAVLFSSGQWGVWELDAQSGIRSVPVGGIPDIYSPASVRSTDMYWLPLPQHDGNGGVVVTSGEDSSLAFTYIKHGTVPSSTSTSGPNTPKFDASIFAAGGISPKHGMDSASVLSDDHAANSFRKMVGVYLTRQQHRLLRTCVACSPCAYLAQIRGLLDIEVLVCIPGLQSVVILPFSLKPDHSFPESS